MIHTGCRCRSCRHRRCTRSAVRYVYDRRNANGTWLPYLSIDNVCSLVVKRSCHTILEHLCFFGGGLTWRGRRVFPETIGGTLFLSIAVCRAVPSSDFARRAGVAFCRCLSTLGGAAGVCSEIGSEVVVQAIERRGSEIANKAV